MIIKTDGLLMNDHTDGLLMNDHAYGLLMNDHTDGLLMTKIQWIEQIIVSPIYCFKQNTVHT
jgi:hypothetical protein